LTTLFHILHVSPTDWLKKKVMATRPQHTWDAISNAAVNAGVGLQRSHIDDLHWLDVFTYGSSADATL
jgi:hypothetical protein